MVILNKAGKSKIGELTLEEREYFRKQALLETETRIEDLSRKNPLFLDFFEKLPKAHHRLFSNVFTLKKSRTAALKAKCLDCCLYDKTEVAKCENFLCPLHSFRV